MKKTAEATLAEHVAKAVDEAPPLSRAQRDSLAILLRGGSLAERPETQEEKERRLLEERELRIQEERATQIKTLADLMQSCGICELTPATHAAQKHHSMGYHDFVQMSDQQLKAIAIKIESLTTT